MIRNTVERNAPNKAPPIWRILAEQVRAEGVARYGELGISVTELAAWIELVRGSGSGEPGNGAPAAPRRLNPDLYLAAALSGGRSEAWNLWHEELELPLVRWLTRLGGGPRLGEELVAELAGDLFGGKLKDYRGDAALRTWLTVVVRNRLTDQLRKEARRGVSLTLWAGGEPRSELSSSAEELSDEVAGRCDGEALAGLLKEELEKLEITEKRLIVQYFLAGTRMRDLAREYGVNRTQIGRRLKSLCIKLRASLVARGAPEVEGVPPRVNAEVLTHLELPGLTLLRDGSGAPEAAPADPRVDETLAESLPEWPRMAGGTR